MTSELAEDYASFSVTKTATAELTGDPTPENNTDTATTAVSRPIPGAGEEPATGQPPASTQPQQPEAAKEEPAKEEVAALPFTGSSTDMRLGLGAGLSVIGLVPALTGRRRRLVE